MNDIKNIVAHNIAELRKAANMTQLELAEKLNYSDKAVSKWEHGDSIPDVTVLLEIADLFGVTLDFLVRTAHTPDEIKKRFAKSRKYSRRVILLLSILCVWFLAVLSFILVSLIWPNAQHVWLSFIYAIPASAIVWLVLNSVWFNRKVNYFIISLLMWTAILSIHLSLLLAGHNTSIIYIIGIPSQIIILLWSFLKKRPKK